MDSLFPALFLLVPALGLAWLAGYRSRFRKIPGLKRSPEQDYFVGLNYLLNDEPDDAIDIFTNALELNSDTLETHLALCTLLRRRGKVDRSIAHCQNLLASQHFSARDLNEIRINLVRSLIAAGLLDRAERLVEELKQGPQPVREAALGLAITVYQMERDWPQALNAAIDLLKICHPARKADLQLQTSHFYCELAEVALNQGDYRAAREELKKATATSRNNVRSWLLLGRLETPENNPKEAVKALQKVPQYDSAFAGEAMPALLDNLQRAGLDKQLNRLLESAGEGTPGSRELLALIEVVEARLGRAAALDVLQRQLKRNPSLGVLAETLATAAGTQAGEQTAVLELGAATLQQHLQNSAQYRCSNCGFELRNLHWLCPGCSTWGMARPLEGKLISSQ